MYYKEKLYFKLAYNFEFNVLNELLLNFNNDLKKFFVFQHLFINYSVEILINLNRQNGKKNLWPYLFYHYSTILHADIMLIMGSKKFSTHRL